MSLARAVLSGIVYRNPEKRFTGNNVPVTSFALNIGEKEVSLIRVLARGNTADQLEQAVSKGSKIVVEGRLQMTSVQNEDGSEKKITEIDVSSFEVISASGSSSASSYEKMPQTNAKQASENSVVEFSDTDMTDTLIGEEEIPF